MAYGLFSLSWLLLACSEETPSPASIGSNLEAELRWPTSRSSLSTTTLPDTVARVRAIVSDSAGAVLRDFDGNLLDLTVTQDQGFLSFGRVPGGTNRSLEVRGYDNDSHLIYQAKQQGIDITNEAPLIPLEVGMEEIDTVAPFNTVLQVTGSSLSSGTATLQLSARDNWGVDKYYLSLSPNRPSLSDAGWKAANGERYFVTTETLDLQLDPNRTLTSAVEVVRVYAWFADLSLNGTQRISPVQQTEVVLSHGIDELPSQLSLATSWDTNFSSQRQLLLDLSAVDDYGLTAFLVSDNASEPTPSDSDPRWQAIVPSQKSLARTQVPLTISSGNSLAALRFWVRDTGGQVRASDSLGIQLKDEDTIAPRLLSAVVNQGETKTSIPEVRLDLQGVDDRQLHSFFVSQDPTTPTNASKWTSLNLVERDNCAALPLDNRCQQWTTYFEFPTTRNRGLQDLYLWLRDDSNSGMVSSRKTVVFEYVPPPGFTSSVCRDGVCGVTRLEEWKNYRLRIQLTGEPAEDVPVKVETDNSSISSIRFSNARTHTFRREYWSTIWELNFQTSGTQNTPVQFYLDFLPDPGVVHDPDYARLGKYVLTTLNF